MGHSRWESELETKKGSELIIFNGRSTGQMGKGSGI